MAWERLFETDQLEIIVDTNKGHVMLETSSGGAVPSGEQTKSVTHLFLNH